MQQTSVAGSRRVESLGRLKGTGLHLSERIGTTRLVFRRPRLDDAAAIFAGWAADPIATQYMAWRRHRSPEDTLEFLRFSELEWERWPAGPYVIELGDSGVLIGSCGFGFRGESRAEIGYILSPSRWRLGYATEALQAQIEVAAGHLTPIALQASVHPDNLASQRVLSKCGFTADASGVRQTFPNLEGNPDVAAIRYELELVRRPGG